jgi:hypothetical protein
MTAMSKPGTDLFASRPVSWLTIISLFSVVGMATSLLFALFGIRT